MRHPAEAKEYYADDSMKLMKTERGNARVH